MFDFASLSCFYHMFSMSVIEPLNEHDYSYKCLSNEHADGLHEWMEEFSPSSLIDYLYILEFEFCVSRCVPMVLMAPNSTKRGTRAST